MAPSRQIHLLVNSLRGGGAEILNVELAQKLGWPLRLLEDEQDYPTQQTPDCLSGLNRRSPGWWKLLWSPWLAWRLAGRVANDDVVVASLFRSIVVAVLCRLLLRKIRVVAWLHNDPNRLPGRPGSGWKFRAMRWLYHQCDFLVPNSRHAQSVLESRFGIPPHRLRLIYNGFDGDRIRKLGGESVASGGGRTFGTELVVVGSHTPVKGQEAFLRVFACLREHRPDVRLTLVGKGPLTDRLREQAAQLGIADSVQFTGFQSNPFAWMTRADLLVFPSHSEGFGNVLVEALNLGLPIVAADIDAGPREILAPNSIVSRRTKAAESATFGWLLPGLHPGTSVDAPWNAMEMLWAETLDGLLNQPAVRDALAARGTIRARDFDHSRIHQQWCEWLAPSAKPSRPAQSGRPAAHVPFLRVDAWNPAPESMTVENSRP